MFSALPPNATCLYYFPYFRPAVFNVMFTEKTLYIAFKTKKNHQITKSPKFISFIDCEQLIS